MQVAGDSVGNSYVADSALGEIVMFAAGSSASTGTPILSGLTAPTGVAVDGSGNVYVGASGSVYAIPYVGGKLWPANKMTLATGLGNHLNLAVDGAGNVYVADADNARVVKIPNQSMADCYSLMLRLSPLVPALRVLRL
jgi:DNA-binding beta-propeller fold protein YncE